MLARSLHGNQSRSGSGTGGGCIAFFLAQLRPWSRGRSGFLLVLGTANVDECLRGYLTKCAACPAGPCLGERAGLCSSYREIRRYDCSSADINPIGSISKNDLRRFLVWAAEHLGYGELTRVVAAPPTAELEPVREGVAAQVGLWRRGLASTQRRTSALMGCPLQCNACASSWTKWTWA